MKRKHLTKGLAVVSKSTNIPRYTFIVHQHVFEDHVSLRSYNKKAKLSIFYQEALTSTRSYYKFFRIDYLLNIFFQFSFIFYFEVCFTKYARLFRFFYTFTFIFFVFFFKNAVTRSVANVNNRPSMFLSCKIYFFFSFLIRIGIMTTFSNMLNI